MMLRLVRTLTRLLSSNNIDAPKSSSQGRHGVWHQKPVPKPRWKMDRQIFKLYRWSYREWCHNSICYPCGNLQSYDARKKLEIEVPSSRVSYWRTSRVRSWRAIPVSLLHLYYNHSNTNTTSRNHHLTGTASLSCAIQSFIHRSAQFTKTLEEHQEVAKAHLFLLYTTLHVKLKPLIAAKRTT